MSTAEDTADTVLERKAIAQRRALGVGAVSVPRALGRSLSIASDALWALGLVATVRADASVPTTRALADLTDDQLLVVLKKDGAPCGLAAFDRALVTGLTEWHINAQEPDLLGYSSQFNNPGFYGDTVFAASDHDPLILGLDLETQMMG